MDDGSDAFFANEQAAAMAQRSPLYTSSIHVDTGYSPSHPQAIPLGHRSYEVVGGIPVGTVLSPPAHDAPLVFDQPPPVIGSPPGRRPPAPLPVNARPW